MGKLNLIVVLILSATLGCDKVLPIDCHWEQHGDWTLVRNFDGREVGGVAVYDALAPGMFYPTDNGSLYRGYNTLEKAKADAVARANCRLSNGG